MRKWLLILVLMFFLLSPQSAAGQGQVTFSTVNIDIRPEYDRASVLVIYDIEIPQSALGSQISLRIPASAGEPFALAYGPGDGSLFDLQYTRQVSGEWAFLNFSPPMAFLRVEFYDPTIERTGDMRSFSYIWPGDYDVGAMTILVMEPYSATAMQITPGVWESRTDSNGMIFYGSEIGEVRSGEQIELKIGYQKTVDDLTIEHLPVQSSVSLTAGDGNGIGWQEIIPWVLGILGAAMVIGGLYWYWKTGRQGWGSIHRRQRPRPAAPVTDSPPATDAEQGGYCHQCGNRTAATDRFCRVCGTRLRSE